MRVFYMEKRLLRKNNCGGILIEFTVCIPLMIILALYINDVNRLKRIEARMRFASHEIASILQNVTSTRENKNITQNDIINATYAASLSVFLENPLLNVVPGRCRYAVLPECDVHYIHCNADEGDNYGKVTDKWNKRLWFSTGNPHPRMTLAEPQAANLVVSTAEEANELCPGLSIKPGENKIIVEHCISYSPGLKYLDGTYASLRKMCGTYFVDPPGLKNNTGGGHYFISISIFTPKPGVFDNAPL